MNSKHILIISPYAFGYTQYINKALKQIPNVSSQIIYLDKPKFAYKNKLHRIQNFCSKLFGKNLKKNFIYNRIKKETLKLQKQNIIFIIRPDILDNNTLKFLKKRTNKFMAYYYDSTRRFNRKTEIISFFDTVYSYDKIDVERYNLKFLTNYIFEENTSKNYKYLFFNISTYDYRFPVIEALAKSLKENKWSYNILVYYFGKVTSHYVNIITTQKSIVEVAQLIKQSKIIVDIQREDQVGLSFRAFEALGYRKKLITNNIDIINYDFYNPNNILVVDKDHIQIPEAFVNSPYQEVDNHILDRYRIKNWVKYVFEL